MAPGFDGKLHILLSDHRGSFQRRIVGVDEPTREGATARIAADYLPFMQVDEHGEGH